MYTCNTLYAMNTIATFLRRRSSPLGIEMCVCRERLVSQDLGCVRMIWCSSFFEGVVTASLVDWELGSGAMELGAEDIMIPYSGKVQLLVQRIVA